MQPNIIFEDDSILIYDKPSGLVVNASQTIKEETFQDQLIKYLKINGLGIGDRAGIVHRLDRETSGLLVVAKNEPAFDLLQKQFKERKVNKEYIALVHGFIKKNSGIINAPILRSNFGKFTVSKKGEGREAVTRYEVSANYRFSEDKLRKIGAGLTRARLNYLLAHAALYSFVTLNPKTGRTHQIRVHMKSLGHPVVSDLIYLPKKLIKFDLLWCKRLFLHARRIEFLHPKTKKAVCFESPLPNDLKDAILNLELV